ncbi:DUF4364 family protein [Ruminococcus sp. LCP21S3_E8]|nr:MULTISPECIES: DUF4364 family protein [Ruminococcus]MCI5597934.1 DUF4364 family protein [Ruminococcus sp.]MCI5617884.1 DUF4364 family protein [Ruminococcus sp.]MDD6531158.1 DUF4364 family protein [Ruminococcus sp.]MDD6710422.1 DUF4364 family protein [Ruminococcus sp.]
MSFDTFDEGINPGGMRSKNEIRILICYLIKSVKAPVSKELILESLQKDGLANYFEASACFDDLVKNRHITVNDNNKYILTEDGMMIATQLEDSLAYTVKEKAFHCVMMLLEEEKTERENKVEIVKNERGYNVKCSITSEGLTILSLEFYVPDYEQAKLVKKNFRKNPELLYKTTISVLSKQKDLLTDTLKDLEMLS